MRASPDRRSSRGRRPRSARAALAAALLLSAAAPSASSAATISAGTWHTCAVTSDAGVACWGENGDGQLGNGTTSDASKPVDVVGISDAAEVAAGSTHTCALRAAGTVSCWGRGEHTGALGDGQDLSSTTPVTVSGLTDAVAVAAGSSTSCALTEEGEIFCWGSGMAPPSNGIPGSAVSPVQLPGVSDAKDLSVGDGEICAIGAATTDCWTIWQDLNNGTATASPSLTALPASSAIQQTTGGVFGGCGLLASGQVSCHGSNRRGQLGNGVSGGAWASDRTPRGKSLALGITDARAVASPGESNCALLDTGRVKCWGGIGRGLGHSSGDNSDIIATPAFVSGVADAVGIAAGYGHVCVVDRAGAVDCWGLNFDGQLGNGTDAESVCPTPVPGVKVAASPRYAVTPIRRDDPDVTVPAPVQLAGTTPPPPSPETLPCVIPPLPPRSTTPTTPVSPPPTIGPGIAGAIKIAPTLSVKGGAVSLVSFRVPQRWAGKCPKTTKVTVRAAGRSKSKTFRVKRTEAGACEITGLLTLRGRMASASKVTVTFRPKGVRSFKRRISAT